MRGEGYSLSDIAAATGNGNGGFGGDYGAWWIIIIIVLFGGWGRNGNWGGGSDGGSNTIPFYQSLDTDFATIERKIDGVYSGICDATFSLNNTITNGNAAIQNTLTQGFAGLNTGMIQQGYENRIATNSVGTQLSQCCCDLKQQLSNNMYETAKGFCSTNNTIAMSSRDIIDQMNANYRAIHDELVANKLELKNDRIAELNSQVSALQLAASQERQNAYLVDKLNPNKCPIPAYLTCNPNAPLNYSINYSNNGCGC